VGHGGKPVGPGFGARRFATADVSDHDHYLAPGTGSLAALARIAGGSVRPAARGPVTGGRRGSPAAPARISEATA
jgi:hypothetical protein